MKTKKRIKKHLMEALEQNMYKHTEQGKVDVNFLTSEGSYLIVATAVLADMAIEDPFIMEHREMFLGFAIRILQALMTFEMERPLKDVLNVELEDEDEAK